MRSPRHLLCLLALCAGTLGAAEPKALHVTLRGRVDLDFVWVPPGSFQMGSPTGEVDEQPVRRVELRKGFWMSRCEISQRQYESVMSTNPSSFRGPELPVDSVSFRDVQNFLAKLPLRSSLPADLLARLPTEAEWEYACRGGAESPTPEQPAAEALAPVAWFADNSQLTTHPCGRLAPNGYGLHDLLGNVWEWCNDSYLERYYALAESHEDPSGPQVGSTRVLRGGCWRSEPAACRPANRFQYRIWSKDHTVGFRLVLVPK
jgi:formylglycine-generating enzyme required for sulfatase activity